MKAMMTRLLLALEVALLICLARPAPAYELEFLVDPRPARARMFGYEYNQKNHTDLPAPLILERNGEALPPATNGKRYRLLGLRFRSTSDVEEELRFDSRQIAADKDFKLLLPPGETITRYFTLREPKDRKVVIEVEPKGAREPTRHEVELPANGRVARRPEEVFWIGVELEREDDERRKFKARTAHITVRDDLDLPVAGAHLLLLLEGGMMVYEGDTGEDGTWRGPVIPGSFEVFAFAEVPDRTDRSRPTAVMQLPRLLVMRGVLADGACELLLRPDRVVDVETRLTGGTSVVPQKLWITPEPLVGAYQYALIARTRGSRARLESAREHPLGHFLLLTSKGLGSHFAGAAALDSARTLLLRGVVTREAEQFHLEIDPAHQAVATIEPATGLGAGESAAVTLTALGSVRESVSVDTSEKHTFLLPADGYRTSILYRLAGGIEIPLLPYRLQAAPGTPVDLTPRGPIDTPLYWRRDAKKVQFWLGVIDAGGRIFPAVSGGRLTGTFRGESYIDRTLETLGCEYAQGFESVDLEKIDYRAEIWIGSEKIETRPHLERTTVYNVEGQSAEAPACFADRVEQLLPEVRKTIEGCWERIGLPDGMRRLHLDFMIFLPPGIGGTGGGGQITFDIAALFPFTGASDLLPGAYRHELGHNIGFGHDPYMLMMPAAVDEARFGSYGYRMLNAEHFARTLLYLEGNRFEEREPWHPSDGVYAGLRLLFGVDIHKKMLTERRASEQTLVLHGLSSIERIATLYSLVTGQNVAWIFRAHGWPVFDERIEIGLYAVRSAKVHPLQLNYPRLEGTPISSWWVLGPSHEKSEETAWRKVAWPTCFVRLDEDRPPVDHVQRYQLFRRIQLPEECDVRLVCASDVQLQVLLNGTVVNFLDASPQYSQPEHDEMMLNQKRGLPVHLYAGENVIEALAVQPPGSRGFLLEFLDERGDPVRLAFDDDGPDGVTGAKKPVLVAARSPILNGSFELGETLPTAWTVGPIEPEEGIHWKLDREHKIDGERSLRLTLLTQARGGLIQRFVVEPGKKYRVKAAIRTEGLDGETFVSFFTGDAHSQHGKTEPLRARDQEWSLFEFTWFAGLNRAFYVSCYVKGRSGKVWFDKLEMTEER